MHVALAYGPEGEYAEEPDKINTEIAVDIPEEKEDSTEEDRENGEENAANVIVGTWKNIPDPEKEWMTSESDFSEVHDFEYGSYYWPKIAEYGDLIGQGLLDMAEALSEGDAEEEWEALPCTLEEVMILDFTGDDRDEIFVYVESFASYWTNEGAVYILSPAKEGGYTILAENTEFRGGYTDILAPDGTELLSLGYNAPFSWKGGIRYHLGYREGQIVVDKEESYNFQWDLPLMNFVNDFKNGIFYTYVARNPDEGTERFTYYIDLEDSIKIDEETFEPVFLPFTGYKAGENDYPAVCFSFHPFPGGWWQAGGRYPEDAEEYYGEDYDYCVDGRYVEGIAYWIDKAKDDDPDKMLREAVEKSGYQMERVAYPWTEETKKNVTELLRCPVADYYYISDDHAAYYARGEIYFVEIGQ